MRVWLTSKAGLPLDCMDCCFEQQEDSEKRINRAIYRCIECGWLMCRRHAEDHFKPTKCHR